MTTVTRMRNRMLGGRFSSSTSFSRPVITAGREDWLLRSSRSDRVVSRVHCREGSSGRGSMPVNDHLRVLNEDPLTTASSSSSSSSSTVVAAPGTTIASLSASSTIAEKEDLVPNEIGSSSASFHQRLVDAAAAAAGHRASPPPLFPWRHSPELLPRLDPTRVEYEEQGELLGGGVTKSTTSSHRWWDEEMATAGLFLNVPLSQLAFFSDWKQDLATDMSWAFTQGVAGILSNVYQVPMDKIATGDGHLTFDYTSAAASSTSTSPNTSTGSIEPSLQPSAHSKQEEETSNKNKKKNNNNKEEEDNENSMVQSKLKQLYQSAHEFGKHQLQVRLDCRPTSATMQSLFVFPFVSRASLKAIPHLRDKYHTLLHTMMGESPHDSIPLWQGIMNDLRGQHDHHQDWTSSHDRWRMPSTVICQVLVECDEIFWVKDLASGVIVQGGIPLSSSSSSSPSSFRRVVHLVRFEMVVDVMPAHGKNWILPFDMALGRWQITDIDDHLKGNLFL